jgi:2-oxoacid:acceptor oxidoreductase gamma subunit (pyruvate/2-ketoisovalerate family)
MKEIRFHGRGGQGVVKAAHLIVDSAVQEGKYAHFIPFFGVERKGSPVFGYARISDEAINVKDMVYKPNCVIVMDDTLLGSIPVFDGLKEDGIFIINSKKSPQELNFPASVKKAAIVDASKIALETLGRNIPNTAMLGAFVKATEWITLDHVVENIDKLFGGKNTDAAKKAYDEVKIYELQGGSY